MTRNVTVALLAAVLSVLPTASALWPMGAEERGDAAFRQRAQGFLENGVPSSRPIADAIAAYEEALARDPENVGLHCKIMDALYFQGFYVAAEKRERREIFDRLLELSTRALELVEAASGYGGSLDDLPLEEQAAILRHVPDAARAHFWRAAGWGLWGMTHSPLAAIRKGVVKKVRDHAHLVILIDERFDDAGGLRILGRLHTATPRVPLLTDWIDRREGLALLRRAVDISRDHPRNLLFLAEAILKYDRAHRAHAVGLLRELDRRSPRPDELVEESVVLAEARELLSKVARRT